jgi:hypothetical protein
VRFTSFDPTTPPASTFAWKPPPGTKVTEATTPSSSKPGQAHPGTEVKQGSRHFVGSGKRGTPGTEVKQGSPRVVGTGWTSVVVADVPPTLGGSGASPAQALLQNLPKVQGSWGSGRLLQGTLFSAILTDNGKLAIGAVSPALLEQALSAQ